jgi:hypothetical protein
LCLIGCERRQRGAELSSERFPVRFVWSSRLSRDPGNLWLRNLLIDIYETVHAEANARVEQQVVELLKPPI